MKIAIATTQLFNGGVEVLFRGLAIQIREAGHDVVVYTRQTHGPLLRGFVENNIPLIMGPPAEILNTFDAVVVWSMDDHANALRNYRGKVIKPGYFSTVILENHRIDAHIVDSENTDEFVKAIDPNAKTAIWYYMAPPKVLQQEPAYQKYGLSPNQNIVGTLCAHRAVKNIPRLMDVFRKADIPNSVFIVAGDGPATADWKAYAEHTLGDRCKIVGDVPNDEIGGFLGCCSVFLNQYNKGLGGRCLTASEAAGAGCYLITNEHGGAKENILGDYGSVINDDIFDEECPRQLSWFFEYPFHLNTQHRHEIRHLYEEKYNKQGDIVKWITQI